MLVVAMASLSCCYIQSEQLGMAGVGWGRLGSVCCRGAGLCPRGLPSKTADPLRRAALLRAGSAMALRSTNV